jgi:hypothetical protein
MTQDWWRANLAEFWLKEIWPPNSPGSPLDNDAKSVCEQDLAKIPQHSHLK